MLPDYEHIFCDECGGVIGMRDRNSFECACDSCGSSVPLYKLNYDMVMINSMTGWVFPVKYRDKEQLK